MMTEPITSPTEPIAEPVAKRRKNANMLRMFFGNWKSLVGVILFLIFVVIAVFAPLIAPYNPLSTNFTQNLAPSAKHLLGTTTTGQDIFSQFIFGTRATLIVGVGAGLISTFIGLIFGVTGGYHGGWTDNILNFISNIFLVLPSLALLIVVESLVKSTTPLLNGLIIGLTGWAWGARVFRAQAMSLRGREFVTAAKLSGASSLRIMVTEIIPNMTSVIASNIIFAILGAILAESGLAFLGLESVNSVSWGTMLYWSQSGGALLNGAWYWFVPPGLGIALVGLSLVLMNFSIDQITNPRLRQEQGGKRRGRKSARIGA
ncbi:ABC transporter permease [Alicyclobacillus acidoterrestris]|uniref:ABC transporter permease n=1 Tax=Alicyclobacillus acidoterrestris (strain ATCC 49025 / DSM 3922 / CIP 106132 / NCIMB 13137 / GD3B) TaxID=1356854 RepID=A0A9E6ZFA4_ALIAG|nr:ABC transporter permease [Alicyclobacillus acidoterrestris]UNO48840.1 ABC transporter permease [Alicyclobacillus acidoterrestris]